MAVGTRFIDRSREFLKTNYLPKIEARPTGTAAPRTAPPLRLVRRTTA